MPSEHPAHLAVHAPSLQPASALHTAHGGLFYLLNVALSLGLYGDFTMPRAPSLALSPWNLLAWFGHRWFGPAFDADPLAPLLAELSGRPPDQPPARGFVPPSPTGVAGDWLIDAAWLQPWASAPALRWRRTAHRLQARHTAGFLACDLSCGGPPRDGASRWLRHLQRYVQARCALALGCANDHDLPRKLCLHPAQVHRSATALDVLLSLDELPLPLRVAGLDRDPGWIPAAGLGVSFRFE